MRVLAFFTAPKNGRAIDYKRYQEAEAKMVWELYAAGLVREAYSCDSHVCAVMILECQSLAEAKQVSRQLPTVKAGVLRCELVKLDPLPKFSEFFARQKLPLPSWWVN